MGADLQAALRTMLARRRPFNLVGEGDVQSSVWKSEGKETGRTDPLGVKYPGVPRSLGPLAHQPVWLFPAARGGPKRYSLILQSWRRAQRLAKVRYRTPHSLRHTYASISLAAGLPLAYVSRQLGHSNSAITLEVYTHFVPGTIEQGRCALDRTTEKRTTDVK